MKRSVFLLNIPDYCSWGGCEVLLMDYFKRIDTAKHHITLVTTRDEFTEKLQALDIAMDVKIFPKELGLAENEKFAPTYKFFAALKADSFIFIHNGFCMFRWRSFLAAWICSPGRVYASLVLGAPQPLEKPSKKYFGFIPALGLWHRKLIYPYALRGWLSKVTMVISKELKAQVVDWYKYPASRVAVRYHGNNVEQYQPDANVYKQLRTEMGINDGDRVLMNCCRLSDQKCLDRLILAFDQVYQQYKNIVLFIIGDGPLLEELTALVAQKSLQSKIRFLGYQERTDNYMKMADIFVTSSDNEGLSISLCEAMSSGLIVVSTKTSGANEVLDNGINGFAVEKNVDGVASGLLNALALDDTRRSEMQQRAQEFAREHFDVEKNMKINLATLGLN